ncbi:hypothetical protein JOQ06_018594, partial [Pogonophryne albipinna]
KYEAILSIDRDSTSPAPEFSDGAPLCHTPRTIHKPSLSPAIPTGLFSITAAEVRGPVSAGLMVLAASWLAALLVMLLQYSSLELRNFFYHTIPDCLAVIKSLGLLRRPCYIHRASRCKFFYSETPISAVVSGRR